MGSTPVRPCPACGEPIPLPSAVVTCPGCDRDLTVEVERGGGEPYRESAMAVFTPVYRPPPRGSLVCDDGSRIRIPYRPATQVLTLPRAAIVSAVVTLATLGAGERVGVVRSARNRAEGQDAEHSGRPAADLGLPPSFRLTHKPTPRSDRVAPGAWRW